MYFFKGFSEMRGIGLDDYLYLILQGLKLG